MRCPQRAAGIETGAHGVGERGRAGERRGALQRAVAADELPPVARPVRLPLPPVTSSRLISVQIGEGDARSEGRVPWIAREHRAGRGSISVVTNGAEAVRDGPSTHSA